ncbi:Cytochrome c-type biogenesis protein CcmH [Ensifer sp. M14]|uniref:cytochrome c-type biogenesis protein n=1 Tax=Sinorhizobium/Ensifer group TaxID=227292 RepID=UPI00098433C8|nr:MULTISPECIES: cytochrome c-type biogenesis protein [Sinorhizobium/Ensifer group]OOG66912.1 cytochrome c-type biogenesis protein CcmH [Sinorhizobium sp. A49]RDL52441.1 Cytochrome c-type biogenesis protein CcmH [Ensifer sp. M14]
MNRLLLAFFLFLASLGPAFAVNPDEVLPDPALEARARAISAELRCMVCQNQSIDDSNAELAKDLRVLVRERLANGDSDDAVIDYVVSRYGEFVLLKPRLETKTMILWGMPILLLFIGAMTLLVAALKRSRQSRGTPLSDDEKEKLKKLLQP